MNENVNPSPFCDYNPEPEPEIAEPKLPRGVRIGIDVGKVRIGVAASDPDGLLAMPVETVRRGPGDIAKLTNIVANKNATVCYIGLPKHLRGGEGESARDAREFAGQLASKIQAKAKAKKGTANSSADAVVAADIEIRLIDERLTTVSAATQLRAAGRKANRQRAVIDQQAAVIILQSALDTEWLSQKRAGTLAQSAQIAE